VPIYEHQCMSCGHIQETLFTGREKEIAITKCSICGNSAKKIMSCGQFFVHGYNAKNGYNLPDYDDLIDSHGNSKKVWGKK